MLLVFINFPFFINELYIFCVKGKEIPCENTQMYFYNKFFFIVISEKNKKINV